MQVGEGWGGAGWVAGGWEDCRVGCGVVWVVGEAAGAGGSVLAGVEVGEGLLVGDETGDDGVEESDEDEAETLGDEVGPGWL